MAPGPNDPDEPDDLGGDDSDDPNQRNIPNLKGIFCISMSAKATGLMTRVVMPVCRQEDEHQRGVRKQKSEESGQTADFS